MAARQCMDDDPLNASGAKRPRSCPHGEFRKVPQVLSFDAAIQPQRIGRKQLETPHLAGKLTIDKCHQERNTMLRTCLILCGLVLSGPASAECIRPTDAEMQQVRAAFETVLLDSESARFTNVCKLKYEGQSNTHFCGMINAKNSFGAYVGFKPFAATPQPGYADVSDNEFSFCTTRGYVPPAKF